MDKYLLKLRQSMDLESKILMTTQRIYEWVREFGINGCYVSFSGGKDSTVLLHLVRQIYPEIEAVFVDTGLEYTEIRKFVKTFDNVTILRPDMRFDNVIEKYGYPVISKEVSEAVEGARVHIKDGKKYESHYNKLMGLRKTKDGSPSPHNQAKWKFLVDAPFKISNKCCNVMKKKPVHKFYKQTGKAPIVATMAEESRLRTQQYLKQGCNGFNNKIPTSTPMGFWTEQDVLQYIYEKNIPYASVYGEIKKGPDGLFYTTGCKRTGCMFCMFGCHLEKQPNRFQKMQKTHPRQYEYCINNLGIGKVLDYLDIPYKNKNSLF